MAESEIKIKLGADEKPAMGAVSRVRGAFQSLAGAARGVMRALGTFHWAVQAVQSLAGWAKDLHEWLGRSAAEARRLREAIERGEIHRIAENAAESYKYLNERLAETNRLERERNAIIDARRAKSRDIEDAGNELAREREIAALDPASATYEADKAAITRKYARRASELSAARAAEDGAETAKRLAAEAAGKERAADTLQKVRDRQTEAITRQSAIVHRTEMVERTAKDDEAKTKAKENADKARRELEALYAAERETFAAIKQLRRDAESLRTRAAESGYGNAARLRRDATSARLDNEEREEAAKRAAEERAAAERAAEAKRREEDARRKDAEREAERKVLEIAAAGRTMASGIAGADAVSANRLTAMGLGSGVSAKGGLAGDVRRLVDLMKQQIEATKDIKALAGAPAMFAATGTAE